MIFPHIKWPCVCFYMAFGHLNNSFFVCLQSFFVRLYCWSMHSSRGYYEHVMEMCSCVCDE
jgi:hypothetical protein